VFGVEYVTIASDPPGLPFTAEGTGCPSGTLTTPHPPPPGAGCAIAFPSPSQNHAGTARDTFQEWRAGDTSNPPPLAPPPRSASFTGLFSTHWRDPVAVREQRTARPEMVLCAATLAAIALEWMLCEGRQAGLRSALGAGPIRGGGNGRSPSRGLQADP
jgi:hypothetical protein